MPEKEQPLEETDTAAAEEPSVEVASAPTMAGDPERSPRQQVLHDDVKNALFSGGSAPRPETGKVFAGRYRIEQMLGQGGMGEVFRAHDEVLDESVAIKLLPRTMATRPGYYERFVQEVRLARQVSHPSVCRVHDIGEADGQPFISMEYVDGEDLAALLRRIGRLGEEKAVELAHLGMALGSVFVMFFVGAGSAFIMLRYGILAMAFSTFTALLCQILPISLGFGGWWAGVGLLGTMIIAAMAMAGSWLAAASNPSAGAGASSG